MHNPREDLTPDELTDTDLEAIDGGAGFVVKSPLETASTQTSLGRENSIECLSFVDSVRT
jgi:hypothetical protein